MLPQAGRGAAIVLALLLLSPLAVTGSARHNVLEPHPPDLVPGPVTLAGTDEREPTHVCASVINIAPEAPHSTPASPFGVRLRLDAVVNDTFLLVEEPTARRDGTLGGGQTAEFCWTFRLAAGAYRMTLLIDTADEVNESSEENNVGQRYIQVRPPPRPDLELLLLEVRPYRGVAEYPQVFYGAVRNRGGAPSPATVVVIDGPEGELARFETPPLDPGQYAHFSRPHRPENHTAGEFNATLRVDPDDLVAEEREGNNVAVLPFAVLPHPMPDLRVANVTLDGDLQERRSARLVVTLHNAGDRSVGTHATRLLVDGAPVAEVVGARLLAGANATVEFFHVFTRPGAHNLTVVVDADDAFRELDETNNAWLLDVLVGVSPEEAHHPNLVVERFSALPDDPGPGEAVVLNAYVRNAGGNASAPTVLQFRADGRVLGEVPIPAIEPGRWFPATFRWGGHSVGDHALQATVDPRDETPEAHEDDNSHLLHLTLRASAPQQPPPSREPEAPVDLEPADGGVSPPPADGGSATPPLDAPPAEGAVRLTQLDVGTRAVPGGVRGTLVASLRNPSFEPLGRMTVTFYVDGQRVTEKLVEGIEAAGTRAVSSGEIDLPAGEHEVRAEVRLVGASAPADEATQSYAQEEGPRDVPAPGGLPVAASVAAAAAVLFAARRRRIG